MPPTQTDHDHRTAQESRELVLETISTHAASLLSLARRYSYCADDAQDAYQRGLEIFLRRAPTLQSETTAGWLHTVVKNEALAVRRDRQRILGSGAHDPDLEPARHLESADERVASVQELEQAAEALGRLKPQELRALVLKARGYSYAEIGEITGWTYTKVNRCLTEGRRAFMSRYDAIVAGAECERFTLLLSAVADGEADAAAVVSLRAHLRHCGGCRARLRECRGAPGSVAALLPVPLVAAAGHETAASWGRGLAIRFYEAIAGGIHERATLSAQKLQAGLDAVTNGKLAVVAASAAVAGGGVVVAGGPLDDDHAGSRAPTRAAQLRHLAAVTARGPSPSPSRLVSGVAAARSPSRSPSARRVRAPLRRARHAYASATSPSGEFEPSPAGSVSSRPVATAGAAASAGQRTRASAASRATPSAAAPTAEPATTAEFSP